MECEDLELEVAAGVGPDVERGMQQTSAEDTYWVDNKLSTSVPVGPMWSEEISLLIWYKMFLMEIMLLSLCLNSLETYSGQLFPSHSEEVCVCVLARRVALMERSFENVGT